MPRGQGPSCQAARPLPPEVSWSQQRVNAVAERIGVQKPSMAIGDVTANARSVNSHGTAIRSHRIVDPRGGGWGARGDRRGRSRGRSGGRGRCPGCGLWGLTFCRTAQPTSSGRRGGTTPGGGCHGHGRREPQPGGGGARRGRTAAAGPWSRFDLLTGFSGQCILWPPQSLGQRHRGGGACRCVCVGNESSAYGCLCNTRDDPPLWGHERVERVH